MAVVLGGSFGIYYILSAEPDANNGVMELKQIQPNLIGEDELKDNLLVVHPDIPPGKESRYQLYVTPNDAAVMALAAQVEGSEQCYAEAVGWTWVSDPTLHGQREMWLMPHEFLVDTPGYATNPVKPNIVSDCEEQANTLVSLLRAEGIQPQNVRVVLGNVNFGGDAGGHAWVELKYEGKWLPLEATSGPYWDDEKGELFHRGGRPFQYYSINDYPEVDVWAYYNDIYYLDPRSGEGNAPDSWRQHQILITD